MKMLTRALACILALGAAAAQAQDAAADYPNKPIKVVVPNPPGGSTDTIARKLLEAVGTQLKQPFVFDYRPAGAGTVGTSFVAKAPPDGYTILASTSTPIVTSPFFTPKLVNYDTARELVTIAQVGSAPQVLYRSSSSRIKSVKDLLEQARKNPGSVSIATNGVGSIGHIALATLQKSQGIRLNYIPFAGTGPVVNAAVADHVDVGLSGFAPARGFIESGKLVPLAVAAPSRSPDFPDVPTFRELGIGGMELFASFMRFYAPAGTPAPIVNKLAAAIVRATEEPEMAKWIRAQSFDIKALPAQPAHAAMLSELAGWRARASELSDVKFE